MFIKQFNTKSEFDNYIQGNAKIGRYFIISDENNNNKPTEYYWDGIDVNFIGGNENYKIVDTIEDRDAIPEDARKNGQIVYVTEERSEYRLESDLVTWITNDLIHNKSTTIESKTYYVDNTSSDETGNGTELNPWQSLEKCLSTIPCNLVHRTNIQLGEGTYNWTSKCNSLLQKFILNDQLRIYGKTELIRSDFTTVGGVVNPNNTFEKTIVGATWNEDAYFGKLIGGTSLDNLAVSGNHAENSLTAADISLGTNITRIYDMKSTISLSEGNYTVGLLGDKAIQIRNLIITSTTRITLYSIGQLTRFISCKFEIPSNQRVDTFGSLNFLDCLIIANHTSNEVLYIREGDWFEIRESILINIANNNTCKAIRSQSGRLCALNLLISNFKYAYSLEGDVDLSPTWIDGSIRSEVFINIDVVFNLLSNGFKLTYPAAATKFYLNNVNYAINLNNLSYNNINIDLIGRIASGDFNLGVFEGTPPPKLVDPSKNFSIQYDGSETFESEYFHYRIVDTIEDRDNIPENERVDGMVVYVSTMYSTYRLSDGISNLHWVLEQININSSETTEIKTYYLSPEGSDETGDGTEINPWQTLKKSFVSIPSILKHVTTIYLKGYSDGTVAEYLLLDEDFNILSNWVLNARLEILGELKLVTEEFTTTGQPNHINNPFRRNLADGKTFESENQYTGYIGGLYNGSSYIYSPIGYHGLDYVTVSNFAEGWHLNSGIYQCQSTIVMDRNRLPLLKGSQRLRIKYIKLSQSPINTVFRVDGTLIEFDSCVILPKGNYLSRLEGNLIFNRCLFLCENTTTPAIRILDSTLSIIGSSQIININPNLSRSESINLRNSKLVFQMIMVQGFAKGVVEESSCELTQFYGHYPIIFDDIGVLFVLRGSGFNFNRGSWYGDNKMYIENVNYYFHIEGGDHNINIDISNYIQNDKQYIIQPFVTSTSGTWKDGEYLSSTHTKGIPAKLVDPSKNFSIQYDGSETFESEYIHYRIVDTIEDRDDIPVTERVESLVVYVSLIQTEYRLSGGISNSHWTLEQFIYNESSTTESKTYYVDNTGSDETGDGTELNPWKTLNKALITIPSNIVPGNSIKIQLGEGSYSVSDKDSILLSKFNLGGNLQILGKLEEVVSGITVDPDPTNIFKSIITSGQVFTENQHFGYLAKSGLSYYPITNHGTQDLVSTINTGINSIHELKTELTFESGKLYPLNGTTQLRFQHLKLVNLKEVRCGNNVKLVFWESCFSNVSSHLSISSETLFRRVLFSGETIIGAGVLLTSQASNIFDLESSIFEIKESSNNTSARMIRSVSSTLRFFGNNLIQNGGYAISTIGNVGGIVLDPNSKLGINNCTSLFDYWGPCKVSLGTNSKFILNNTNYGFTFRNYNTGIDCRINNSIDGSPLISWIDPNNSVPAKLVDVSKGLFITYTGSETFESEYIHYRIVNDITERDNILNNEKTEGMLVYTISGDTEYRWIDNEWSINSTNSGLSDSYWNGVTGTDDIYYNNGKVGINKYPDELLDVNGNINIVSGSTYMIDNQIALRIVNNNNLYSVHVGFDTGSDDITESETAIGHYSLKRNVGKFSVGLGSFAGNDNVGNYSTMIGSSAGSANSGITITSIGFESGYNNTGDYLTSIGGHSGSLNIGDYCTFIGTYSGIENFSNNVVAIGYESASGNTLDNQFIVQQRNININPLIQGDFLNGKVGINTSGATATLDINGNIRIRQGAAEGRVLTCDNSGLASWQTISGTTIGTTTLRNLDDVSPDGSNDDGKALVWSSIDNTHYYVNFPEDNGSSGGFLGGVTQSTSQPIELKQNQWVQPLPTNTYDIEYTFDNFKDQSNASIYVNLSTEDVKLRYIEDNGGYWEKVSFIKPLTEGKTWIGNSFNQAEEYDTLLEWVGTESELTGIGQKYSLETQNYYVVSHDTIRIGKNIITKTINLKDVSNIKILNNVSGKSLLTTNILLRIKQDINEQFTFSIGSYSSSYDNIVNTTSISNSNNNQIYPLILPITISQIGLPSNELKITTGDVYFKITQPTTNDMFVDIIYDAVWI